MKFQQIVANRLEAEVKFNTIQRGPLKTYGKQAFAPEVPAQVLRRGRLVDAPRR